VKSVQAGGQARPLGFQVLRGVDAGELDDFSRPGTDNVHRLLGRVRVDGQRAERCWRDFASDTPAVAQRRLPFPHEEPQAVLEHRDARDTRFPEIGVLVPVRRRGRSGACGRGRACGGNEHQQHGKRNGRRMPQPASSM